MPPKQAARRPLRPRQAAALVAGCLLTRPALAQPAPMQLVPVTPQAAAPAPAAAAPDTFWTRSNLLGTIGGARVALGQLGLSVGLQETSEVLGNLTGGVHQGAAYDGVTELSLGLDTAKAFGWDGGAFNVSALQIHGRNLSSDNLDSLQTASGIAADRAARLWEVWYQQAFLDGAVDVKLGQQSIDQEFMTSQYAGLFVNTMMGWPAVPSYDLYAGGPAYPLSAPGVRLRATTGAITALAGVFDDNPPGGPFDDDAQTRGAERSGTRFNTGTGALIVAEVQYGLNQPAAGQVETAPGSGGLAGTYKLGAWYDTGAFPDQRLDTSGLSLADPASNGQARRYHGNYSLYAAADQAVWVPDRTAARTLAVFARLMGAPGDRNLVDFSFNAGVTLKAPLGGRDSDTAGIGFGLARVGGAAAGLDADTAFYSGTATPRRGMETFLEVTYQYAVAPWWQVQPDFQYTFNPGGGLLNPATGRRIHDEAVLGLRTAITF
jgi:porin